MADEVTVLETESTLVEIFNYDVSKVQVVNETTQVEVLDLDAVDSVVVQGSNVTEQVTVSTLDSVDSVISVEDTNVEVVTVFEQGVPGVSAEGAYNLERITILVENPYNKTHILPNVPRENSLKVFLNGLLERKNSITLSGNQVNFSSLELGIGDEITFDYMYGA